MRPSACTSRVIGGLLALCLALASCYSAGADDEEGAGRSPGGSAGSSSQGRGGEGGSAGEAGSPETAGGSSSGGATAGGTSSSGGATAGAGGGGAGSSSGGSAGGGDPVCAGTDSDGFFADCSACGNDCDAVDDGAATRYACGCSSGCPCGLTCGCYELAPNVAICEICVQ